MAPAVMRTTRSAKVALSTSGASLLAAAPALIVFAIALADSGRFADPDLWGHVRFGQAVLNQGHLTLRDPYSYSALGHIWRNHEWLSEVAMAWLYDLLGVHGLNLLKLVCTSATVVFLAAAEAETDAPWVIQAVVLTVAALAISPQLQFRPQLFTYVLASALLALLARRNYKHSGPLWLVILIFALWANLHGGFVVGLGALAVFTIASTLESRGIVQDRHDARALWLTTLLSALATLATPYGIGTWEAVFHALSNPLTHNVIRDWQPLVPALVSLSREGGAALVFSALSLLLLAALLVSIVLSRNTADAPLIAVAGFMTAAAFVAIRNLALATLAASVPLVHHLDLVVTSYTSSPLQRRPSGASADAGHLGWLTQVVLVILALRIAWVTGLFSGSLESVEQCPTAAVAFIKQNALHGNVLSEFGWGEYLIWHLAPESKVFIDGRYDTVYPARVVEDYLAFESGGPEAERVLKAYPHDFVMVRPLSPVSRLMSEEGDWKLIYRDPVAECYVRSDSQFAAQFGAPTTVRVSPESSFP